MTVKLLWLNDCHCVPLSMSTVLPTQTAVAK